MKSVSNMTKKDFEAVPYRKKFDEDIGLFDSLVILPTRHKHDSGYRCMDFVAVREGKPICRLSGCSDVIHFDGIGGYGFDWVEKYGGVPKTIEPVSWNIDCLPKSGLLQIFCGVHRLKAGCALSSFEIFAIKKKVT